MNDENVKEQILKSINQWPDDEMLMTVSSVFVQHNPNFMRILPERIKIRIDDTLTQEVRLFNPEFDIVERSIVGGIYLVNETQFKREISHSIFMGIFRNKLPKIPGRSLRPWVAPCNHGECSKDGFHDENGRLKWICRKSF